MAAAVTSTASKHDLTINTGKKSQIAFNYAQSKKGVCLHKMEAVPVRRG